MVSPPVDSGGKLSDGETVSWRKDREEGVSLEVRRSKERRDVLLEGKRLTSPSKLGLSSSGSHVLVHALGSGVDFDVDRRSTEALKKGTEEKRRRVSSRFNEDREK